MSIVGTLFVYATDYCGNMIYENGTLNQILVDGGYITLTGTTPYYHYYIQDHLGNNRVVVNPAGTSEQINHYYPFGGLFGESTSIIVSPEGEKAESYTYGPHYAIGGKLERTSYDYDDQIREGKDTEVDYDIIDVPIPEGMTENMFESNIKKAAKQFEGNTEINYNILAPSEKSGNCNTSTTTLLIKAGVTEESIQKLKKEIKGNAHGFGQTRPWTEEERKKAEEDNEKMHQLLAL